VPQSRPHDDWVLPGFLLGTLGGVIIDRLTGAR
jgi:hypothetical protein